MSNSESIRFNARCKVIICMSPSTQRILMPLLRRSFPLSTVGDLTNRCTIQAISAAAQPGLTTFCFIEIAGVDDPILGLLPQLSKIQPRLAITVILPPDRPDLILRCLRLGAHEFLLPPLTQDGFEHAAVKLIKAFPEPESADRPGKLFCVIPAKGACGATTLACALAYQWKRAGTNRVLLADLDPFTGVVDFLLRIKAKASFLDVMQRASELDLALWKAMITTHDGIDILLPPETPGDYPDLTDASPILDFARANYDMVIVDSGGAYGDWSLSQAHLSDEVLLVTTNELTALQRAQRVLRYLEVNGIAKWKIRLILNRYDTQGGLDADMVSSALHMEVYHVLPSDYLAVQKAMLEGNTIPAASKPGKSLALLAAKLSGAPPVAAKTSPLGGLLSRLTRSWV